MHTLHKSLLFYLLTDLGFNALGSEIIHGKPVPDNLMLYMASVQNSSGHHICGGFLVSEGFVVTAAHCDRANPTSVVLGTHNLKKTDNKKMRYSVERSCRHPSFDNVQSGDDIMLLKLSQKARLNRRVQPIQLPKAEIKIRDKGKCRVAGWGFTRTGGEVVKVLQVVNVSILDLKVCKEEWGHIRVKLPANVICAGGYNTNKGFCKGDSGGPLVCSGVAVGVVSFNRDLNCNYPDAPNVYTNVSKYLSWIRGILKQKKCSLWLKPYLGKEKPSELNAAQFMALSSTIKVTHSSVKSCDLHSQIGTQVTCLAGIMHGLHKFLLFHVLTCLGQNVCGSKIINGEEAPQNSMLYMASVQANGVPVCGGFLISKDFVVTAAHCDMRHLHVVLGAHNLKSANKTVRSIGKKCKHPSYNKVGTGNDIMLLKLSSEVELGREIQLIKLPSSDMNIEENKICNVAGWGFTRTGGVPVDALRMVDVSVISWQACEKKWTGLPANVICAGGYNTTKGFCQGDSGGPLVCDARAVGVVSFNRQTICDYPDFPNVYTDISKFLPWINTILEEKDC
ncbi:transmembrane protease serine 9-like [Pempheris klunzingeri]|uniref:transmembrane protease serine 9-like n=1 Tax=Pempheris klunzingeri TaxID=3127111 RepID=UPI00397EE08B